MLAVKVKWQQESLWTVGQRSHQVQAPALPVLGLLVGASASAIASASVGDTEPVIINELLMYVVCQWDKSTAANLFISFYSSSEISNAKWLFSQLFSTHLADCERVTLSVVTQPSAQLAMLRPRILWKY